jgi:signal transduction histidine kinase
MRIIYFFFLLVAIFGFSQKKEGQALIDSLLVELPKMKEDTLKVNILNSLAVSYRYSNTPLSYSYNKKGLELAKKLSFDNGISKAYLGLCIINTTKSEFKEGLVNCQTALKYTKNQKIISSIYNEMGGIYSRQSNYEKALISYFNALKISETIRNKEGVAYAYANIGGLYLSMGNFDKALKSYLKSLEVFEKEKITKNKSVIYSSIGLIYIEQKKYDEAIKYLKPSFELSEKEGNSVNAAMCISALGSAYIGKKNYDLALQYTKKAENIYRETDNIFDLGSVLSDKGRIYFFKAKDEKNATNSKKLLELATISLKEAIEIDIETENLNNANLDNALLSDIQKLQGNYKESLESFKKSVKYKDSVFNSDNKETIKNLEDKREIELRDKELKINKLSLESKEKQKWFYILGIGFLTILGGLLFYQNHKRKQINEKLETLNQNLDQANKTKIRFFSILNHDLRNPVANLIHFLHIQRDNPELLDETSKNRMQTKTITGAENLLSSMEDILLWSKGQMENFKPQPKNVSVNQLFEDTKKVFSGYLKIHFEYHNPENLELFTDENYLKTIVRNLTSNAINIIVFPSASSRAQSRGEGQIPAIIWKAYSENGKTFLSITDNGSGSSQEKFKALYDDTEVVGIKSGLGLHLIRDLAKAIDCEISVDSKIGTGTTFVLKL